MNRKNILITGTNGLLGGESTKLLQEKFNVIALIYREPKVRFENVEYIKLDFSCPWDFNDLPNLDIHSIVHLAQSSNYKSFPDKAADIFMVNTHSTSMLLDYGVKCGAEKFIFASTGGLYEPSNKPVKEESKLLNSQKFTYHFTSKYCGELLCQNYNKEMNIVILRPFFMYGPNQRNSMFLPGLVQRIKNNQKITLHGKNGIKTNPIHVHDCASIIEKIIEKSIDGVINIAGIEELNLKNICKIISEKLDIKPKYDYLVNEPPHLVANINKLIKNLYEPKVIFKTGINDLL